MKILRRTNLFPMSKGIRISYNEAANHLHLWLDVLSLLIRDYISGDYNSETVDRNKIRVHMTINAISAEKI